MIIESIVVGGIVSGIAAGVRVLREHRAASTRRRLQNIEFDRLMRSQQIHQTVAQARRAMVDEGSLWRPESQPP